MKTTLIIFLLLLSNQLSQSQPSQPHQPQGPPVNPGYSFSRGMFIDCADDIVDDVSNNDILGMKDQLLIYIRKNQISYIVLCGLDNSVFLNHAQKVALRKLIREVRTSFPSITIGVSGNRDDWQVSPDMVLPSKFGSTIFPLGDIASINEFNAALNDAGPGDQDRAKCELCKFFIRAAQFGHELPPVGEPSFVQSGFDALYVEYRYWEETTLASMQSEFSNFMKILSVNQIIRRNFSYIRYADAEFLPSNTFMLQAWTAIDQITSADPLIDRIMIPAFTGNATAPFDIVCKTMHFLSDQFSKPNSRIFLSLSAESSRFNYCDSVATPPDYMGDYLDGWSTPGGNLYSVEKIYIDKCNNPLTWCAACSCRPYTDNHYTATNTTGNSLVGVMWRPYTMLATNRLYRMQTAMENVFEKSVIDISWYDMSGKKIGNTLIESQLGEGIYLRKTIYDDGSVEVKKTPVIRQ